MKRLLVALPIATLVACGQEITVFDCGIHEESDGGTTRPDAPSPITPDTGTPGPNDTGSNPDPDGGPTNPDAMTGDAETPPDGGMMSGCIGAPYCLRALAPAMPKANVRQPVMFTPMIENPNGTALQFRVSATDVTATRRSPLPAAVMSDIQLDVAVDMTGRVTFTITEVPTWFTTTTFHIVLHAKGPGAMPEVSVEGTVDIRGNVLFSGYSAVYAVASDGRPARSLNFTQGKLIEGSSFVSTPDYLLLARDGTLLVYDSGATPERIRRFELTGENVHLGDFEFQDSMSMPYIIDGNLGTGMTQMMDGRIVLPVYNFSRTPDSGLIFWNEDGTYDHTANALNPSDRWQGVAASKTTNELYVVTRGSSGVLFEIDPETGIQLGNNIATDITYAWALLAMPNGNFYAGCDGQILRVTPQGGKTQVSMLMTSGSDYWYALAPFTDGRVLAVRDSSSDYTNIVIIDGTTNQGYLRPMSVGGASSTPTGVVYLE